MQDESYFNNLINRISKNITAEYNRIAVAQGKIDRLKKAYNKVETQKQAVKSLKKECGKVTDDLKWKGAAFDSCKKAVDEMKSKADTYKSRVDTLMDDILDEISRLENSKSSSWNIIGGLNGRLAEARNELKKILN